MIYLDHNATSPIRPEVAEAVARASVAFAGNPSSVHAAGRQARDAVERARDQVARLVGALAEEIVFTSGGTEADNLAIRGLAALGGARGRRHIITSPLDHPAVRGTVTALSGGADDGLSHRFETTDLPVSARGEIRVADLEAALRDDTALVTLALANHELGNIYPIAALAAASRARGALMHTDAVQALGKIPVDFAALGVDAAAVSAHKIGGPKGAGAVFIRRGLDLPPLFSGGHQERERRPGTENVPAIVGFGLACEMAQATLAVEAQRLEALRRQLITGLRMIPGAVLVGAGHDGGRDDSGDSGRERDVLETAGRPSIGETPGASDRARQPGCLPGTVMVRFKGAPGQLVAISLDLEGTCVSTGAACTSGSLEPSPVLRALGLSEQEAGEGVRISLGWTTAAPDVARLLEILPDIVARVRGAASPALSDALVGVDAAVPTAARESPGWGGVA